MAKKEDWEIYAEQYPDVAAAYQVDNYGLTPAQFAQKHYDLYGRNEQRVPPGYVPISSPSGPLSATTPRGLGAFMSRPGAPAPAPTPFTPAAMRPDQTPGRTIDPFTGKVTFTNSFLPRDVRRPPPAEKKDDPVVAPPVMPPPSGVIGDGGGGGAGGGAGGDNSGTGFGDDGVGPTFGTGNDSLDGLDLGDGNDGGLDAANDAALAAAENGIALGGNGLNAGPSGNDSLDATIAAAISAAAIDGMFGEGAGGGGGGGDGSGAGADGEGNGVGGMGVGDGGSGDAPFAGGGFVGRYAEGGGVSVGGGAPGPSPGPMTALTPAQLGSTFSEPNYGDLFGFRKDVIYNPQLIRAEQAAKQRFSTDEIRAMNEDYLRRVGVSNVPGYNSGGVAAAAESLSDYGRRGDSMLVHMDPSEVKGLAALAEMDGEQLTINPYTGLPEAFSLKKLFKKIMKVVPFVAPFIPGVGPVAAAALSGVAGGFGGKKGFDFKRGLMSGLTSYGIGSLGRGLSGAGGMAPGADAFASAENGIALGGSGLSGATQAAPSIYEQIAGIPSNISGLPSNLSNMASGAKNLITNAPGAMSAFRAGVGMSPMAAGQIGLLGYSGLNAANEIDKAEEEQEEREAERERERARYSELFRTSAANSGYSAYAEGGDVSGYRMAQRERDDGIDASVVGAGGSLSIDDILRLQAGANAVRSELPDGRGVSRNFANLGASTNIGDIGLNASVVKSLDVDKVYQGMLNGTIPFGVGKLILGIQGVKTPNFEGHTSKTVGYAAPMGKGMLQADAIFPREGKPQGRIAYRGKFAEGGDVEATTPRMIQGPGDGMSDEVVASIDGEQEARLADGEFVIPADVVADIGNGSSGAGARKLYAMMDRIRQARHGTTEQPPEVRVEKYMPA